MSAIRITASEIARRAKNRLNTALPAAADQQPEQHAGDEHDHRRAERALFHLVDHTLRRALGFAPAALRGFTNLISSFGAALPGGVFEDFTDLGEIGAQIPQFVAER